MSSPDPRTKGKRIEGWEEGGKEVQRASPAPGKKSENVCEEKWGSQRRRRKEIERHQVCGVNELGKEP